MSQTLWKPAGHVFLRKYKSCFAKNKSFILYVCSLTGAKLHSLLIECIAECGVVESLCRVQAESDASGLVASLCRV